MAIQLVAGYIFGGIMIPLRERLVALEHLGEGADARKREMLSDIKNCHLVIVAIVFLSIALQWRSLAVMARRKENHDNKKQK